MATAAFKSNSKRSNNNDNNKSNPNNQKQRLRRSSSVSAISRTTTSCEEFLNKRDNPLYWAASDNNKSNNVVLEEESLNVGQRGRSAVRNSAKGNGRPARSVSRPRLASSTPLPAAAAFQSEAEQESRTGTTYGGRSGSIRSSSSTGKLPVLGVKSFDRRSAHPSRHPSVGSSFDSQVSNWEDGISTSSLSEAEEKTIKAVYEQMKSLEGDNSRKDTTSSEIYETVRSEVRRAIADIQDDLQDAIRRNTSAALVSTDASDVSKLVKPGAVELVLDIRREYTKELEESQERARKLRSDLAIEEHRKQELSRILKETLPEPKTSSSHRSRGRKSSSERKKMSKRLTDEAMSYFDECVSISAFDSSDFSAAEDPSVNSVTTTPIRGADISSGPNRCIDQQMMHDDLGSSSVVDSSCNEPVMDRVVEITNSTESERKTHFSFGHKPTESIELQHDIKNYIKTFEKDKGLDDIASEKSRANYNVDAYSLLDVGESLLFDKVFLKNRQESGSLHICGGVAVPFLPLVHLL